MDKTKGLWIPIEVLQMDLTPVEKMVYAYYLQLSDGKKGAAWGTNEDICEVLGISKYRLRDSVKPSLRKKGLIETSGIRTICIVKNTTPCSEKHDTNETTECSEKHDTNETTECSEKHDTNEDSCSEKHDGECSEKHDGECSEKHYTKKEIKNNIKLNGDINKELVNEEKKQNYSNIPTVDISETLWSQLSGLGWKDFEDRWVEFIQSIKESKFNSKEDLKRRCYNTFMELLPQKTKFIETTKPKWETEYRNTKQKKVVKVPEELVDLVIKNLKPHEHTHDCLRTVLPLFKNGEFKEWISKVDDVLNAVERKLKSQTK